MQADPSLTLPEPDPESLLHSERVAQSIHDAIDAAGGSISFAEFMQHALYAPGLGYYVAGCRKFGEAGDFVTAPEVSPLFAKVLAKQVASAMEESTGSAILELGAGSGLMAVDLLQRLNELDALPDRYLILEVSAELQQRQQQLISQHLPAESQRVEWLDQLPQKFCGIIIANEVADALPVERFIRDANGVKQLRVVCRENNFEWRAENAAPLLLNAVLNIEKDIGRQLESGYVSELSPGIGPWVTDICECVERGFVFLFDYGVSRREYYAPDRQGGWLRCHFRHRVHDDPLKLPGIQDLTAWVDFTAIAEAASNAGCDVAGYVTQSQFLMNGGLPQELESMVSRSTAEQLDVAGQIKSLTLPGEMGENFKCIGLSVGGDWRPSGFAFGDRAHVL